MILGTSIIQVFKEGKDFFFFNGISYSVAGQALQTPALLITGENLS